MNTENPHHDALMAVAHSLTVAEAATIRAFAAASRMDGAEPADWIAEADNADAYLDRIEPVFAEHGDELPGVTGTRYAMYALIALGLDLSPLNIKKLLLRAGLLPKPESALAWKRYIVPSVSVVAGYEAEGDRWHYLVARSAVDGRFLLCRWLKHPGYSLGDIHQAVSTLIEVSTPDEGRRFAEQFERGADIGHAVAWHHVPRPAQVTS
jgi:hypothetical protein